MPFVREEVQMFRIIPRCIACRCFLLALARALAPLSGLCFLWKFECRKSRLRGVPKLPCELPKLRCNLFEMLQSTLGM